MSNKAPNSPSELVSVEPPTEVSMEQITALVSGVMDGFQPIAKQQAEVQLRQIDANEQQDKRRFQFAKTQLLIGTGILVLVVALLAAAAAFLFNKGSDSAGLQVIWFGLGAIGGFGVGRAGKPQQ